MLIDIRSYDEALTSDASIERLYADKNEQETIDFMIQNLPSLSLGQAEHARRLRDFASYISLEETLPMSCQMLVRHYS